MNTTPSTRSRLLPICSPSAYDRRVRGAGRRSFQRALLAIVLVLVGCTAAPTPTPTLEPTAIPTQTPVDVVEVFTDALLDPGFSAEALITGSFAAAGTDGSISGSAEFNGPDARQDLVISIGGLQTKTETITADGEQYVRTGEGPWTHQPAAAASPTLQSEFLEIVADLEDEGAVQFDGKTLHHLVRATPVELTGDFFGLTDPAITDFVGAVDFYANADGTPAILHFALSWIQAGSAFEMDLQYGLDLDVTPTIVAPQDVWTSFSSDRFAYTMAYPEAWVVEEAADGTDVRDLFSSLPDVAGLRGEVQISFYTDLDDGLAAAEWFAESSALLAQVFGVAVETSEPITVGSLDARYFALHYSDDGFPVFFQEAVVFAGGHAWDIDWYSEAGAEADDRAVFETFLATFEPGTP